MAQGGFICFDQFLVDACEGLHDLENDDIKLALITNAATPDATTPDPRWGAGGGTNFATNEASPTGGSYASGGTSCGFTVTLSSGAAFVNFGNVFLNKHASNPTNARWAILYNNTDAGKRCIAYGDLGSDFDLTRGDLNMSFISPSISLNQA